MLNASSRSPRPARASVLGTKLRSARANTLAPRNGQVLDGAPRVRPLVALVACALIMFWIGPLYAWSLFVEPLEVLLLRSRASISGVFSIANAGFSIGLRVGRFTYGRMPLAALSIRTIAMGAGGLPIAASYMTFWAVSVGYGRLSDLANGLGHARCLQIVHKYASGARQAS